MELAVAIMGWTLFGLAIFVGLALDLAGLFGNWIIWAAVAVLWSVTGFEHFGLWTMILLGGLVALGEVLEMAMAGYGASRFGGGRGTVVAAIVGCLVGAVIGTPWFPLVGTLAGACLGAFVAAAGYEFFMLEKQAHLAVWTGLGAALGKVGGLLAKLLVGVAMVVTAYLTY